jgi:hypothetical protein
LVSNTLLHKPFEHEIKSIRDFDFPLCTITSELFTKAFNTRWGIWKNEIERFRNIQEWWCFILVSNTLLHKPFEHKIKSIRDFDFPL